MNVDFQEQIDNELVPYKLPDGSVIQVRSPAMHYIIIMLKHCSVSAMGA